MKAQLELAKLLLLNKRIDRGYIVEPISQAPDWMTVGLHYSYEKTLHVRMPVPTATC